LTLLAKEGGKAMEGRLWTIVVSLLPAAQPARGRRRYDERTVLMVGLWAVLHDRPACWACRPEHWPRWWRPAALPHPSTLSRRWRSGPVQAAAATVHRRALAQFGPPGRYAALDGRSLPVARHSTDPHARCGRGAGGMARGYKLHAVVSAGGAFLAFAVHPLNVSEPRAARPLVRRLPAEVGRVVADANYDSMPLRRAARSAGRRLYTPLRNGRVGRRQQPERLRMARLAQRRVGRRLLRSRDQIDRCFGRMSNLGCGFKGLPNWCRGLPRVRGWIWGKVLIYHAFLLDQRQAG
jgi:IS5 family transposase